jgi:hypothetical protein
MGGSTVRLVDTVFRGGHLADSALVEAVMTGERPAHLDRCDICAERAVEVGRWMDQVRTAGIEAADEAFPAERLAAQQGQILRRLEQLDQPARVIAFPMQTRAARESGGRRVAAGWVAVAAAAGLAIGVVGGQVTARNGVSTGPEQTVVGPAAQPSVATPEAPVQTPAAPAAAPRTQPAQQTAAVTARLDEGEFDLTRVPSSVLSPLDDSVPRMVATTGIRR